MRVLVVENMDGSHLGQVGVALEEARADIDIRRPYEGDVLPEHTGDHDAIVVFGGTRSAVDDADHPYLAGVARLMRRFGDEGKAVLGICLGSQLLARGYDGENILGAAREFGWTDVALTPDGEADPVLSAAGPTFSSFAWHSDTFSLPADAARLATNATVANQAFRFGRAAYGTQFHFEANRAVVEDWKQNFKETILKIDPEWLKDFAGHAARSAEMSDTAGLALARAWVGVIKA
ncbi:type 1 glutamine amidotransferase [Pararhizobium sp.]|uniref:type 1 glutamine amidotransferase n=1 Tax=Pararhizobium sp. TaxID=1977563 RepID=UPI002722C2F8|nr:type 1 glutamine amidotransferase [Pararhizobium sp.]MDO9416452.1 type 1 glutamine amidotransferase [Pararhizobium sp.]